MKQTKQIKDARFTKVFADEIILSGSGSGSGAILYSPEIVDLYFSTVSGSDSNDGLTSSTPVATWNKLLEIGSGYKVDQIVIHLYQGEVYSNIFSTIPNDVTYIEWRDTSKYVIDKILDFTPLGASTVKIVTDMTGLNTNTPSAATNYTKVHNINRYYTHDPITTNALRWTYNATNKIYNSSDLTMNTATETYIINNEAPLDELEYYDKNDMGRIDISGDNVLFLCSDKLVVFERVWIQCSSFKLIGDISCVGCDIDMSNFFLSDYKISFNACHCPDMELVGGTISVSYSYVNGELAPYFGLNVECFRSFIQNDMYPYGVSSARFAYVDCGGGIRLHNHSTCHANSVGVTNAVEASVKSKLIFSGGNILGGYINLGGNSYAVFNGFTATIRSLGCNSFSTLIFNSGSITASDTSSNFINVYSSSIMEIASGVTITDATNVSATKFIIVERDSKLIIGNSISTATGRSGNLIQVSNGSSFIMNSSLSVTSPSIANSLVYVDNSLMSVLGTLTCNTSANLLLVSKAGVFKSSTPVVNSGAGTVLQRGTSAAGAFVFDTTGYSGTATDEMTLILQI